MSLIDLLKLRNTSFKLILLSFFLFAQSCSDDEILEGDRRSVLVEQTLFASKKSSNKLKLDNPRNISSWTHSGSRPSHNLGNIAFSESASLISQSKVYKTLAAFLL